MKNKSLIEKIYSSTSVEKLKKKVSLLGIYNKLDAITFLNIRFVISMSIFFLCLLIKDFGFIYAPIFTLIFYFGSEYIFIDARIKLRTSKLDYEALFFFEVLTLSLESGRNLKGALDTTVKNIDSELSKEFGSALEEIKYGKTLTEALNNMKKRIPSDTINNVILNITQSNIFGGSIIETLYNQVDYLREKKLQETKAKIAKMPIKVSVISVIFFIPILLLLILTPVIINML
ncbi:MAG: type II secretion system F family protein [Bacilli bacterium]